MEEYIKVKDKDHLYRDSNSNGIVNVDIEGYNLYVQKYNKEYNDSKKIKLIEKDLNDLKNDINEIKSLLRRMANESR